MLGATRQVPTTTVGMIWVVRGRLLSPTGIFASENADNIGRTRSRRRNCIPVTDGQTRSPRDVTYGI